MTKSYVSIGIHYESLNGDKILNSEIAVKFPGALWIAKLDNLINRDLFEIHTSDVILEMIKLGKVLPKDVYLICDETIELSSLELLKLGCKPLILSSFESPIVSRKFYRTIEKYTSIFKYKILFKGIFNNANDNSFETLYFPSYSINDIIGLNSEKANLKLNAIALVMSNVYFEPGNGFSKIWHRAKNLVPFYKNRFTSYHKKIQLYTTRYTAISYLVNKDKLELFGKKWDDLSNLPLKFRKLLEGKKTIVNSSLIPLGKKVDRLTDYKYTLCMENCAYAGYVTEKIIDAIVAKTLPIYLGAPDIEDFIPDNCFINWRKFKSIEEISAYLETLSESAYMEYLENGETFLKSDKGYNFSYEAYANKVHTILINERS